MTTPGPVAAPHPSDDHHAARRHRRRTGVAFLRNGFRPFFLFAGIWAAVAMIVRIADLTGKGLDGLAFDDPNLWHAHELLFGYGGAVVAGFALTAIPNWTGRLPIAGGSLLSLFSLWLAGRLVLLAPFPVIVQFAVDGAFLPVMAAVAAREVVTGKSMRNIPVSALIAMLGLANIVFHLEALDVLPQERLGARAGLVGLVLLIGLIGGRIVPSFTNNWFARVGLPRSPATAAALDRATHAVAGAALALWAVWPTSSVSGAALLLAGSVHGARLGRWRGWLTTREPLVLILHVAYAWIPIGLVLSGISILIDPGISSAGMHALTTGAVGTMTLAVMTRATLGHTGRPLSAGKSTSALYAAISASAMARVAAPFAPQFADVLLIGAAGFWLAAFGLFVAVYGPMHLRPRVGEA